MSKETQWGILGLGKIARKMAEDLRLADGSKLYAVASRTAEKAQHFAEEFEANKYYDSYEDLVKDPSVDVVYIATPHVFHFEHTMLALRHGKHVLCEKPMGMNSEEVRELIKEAVSRKLFLMEGLWTRFIPATEKLLQLLDVKRIGELEEVRADFGFKAAADPNGRLFNPNLGGGSLLDIGIYPLYLSLLTLGSPDHIEAEASLSDQGIDLSCQIKLTYRSAAKAELMSTLIEDTPIEAHIIGSKGKLILHRRFHHSERITWHRDDTTVETFDLPYKGNGYVHEIEEVSQCLRSALIESPKLPHSTSLQLSTLMDQVKELIGLHYSSRL